MSQRGDDSSSNEDECRRLGWDPYEEHLALRLMKALYEGVIE